MGTFGLLRKRKKDRFPVQGCSWKKFHIRMSRTRYRNYLEHWRNTKYKTYRWNERNSKKHWKWNIFELVRGEKIIFRGKKWAFSFAPSLNLTSHCKQWKCRSLRCTATYLDWVTVMQYYRNTSYLMLKTGILSDGFYIFIKNDTDGSGLAILNESAMPIYIESSLNSLKTSQRVVIIRPSESSNVFEMKDFSGKDLKHQKDMNNGSLPKISK